MMIRSSSQVPPSQTELNKNDMGSLVKSLSTSSPNKSCTDIFPSSTGSRLLLLPSSRTYYLDLRHRLPSRRTFAIRSPLEATPPLLLSEHLPIDHLGPEIRRLAKSTRNTRSLQLGHSKSPPHRISSRSRCKGRRTPTSASTVPRHHQTSTQLPGVNGNSR